MNAVQPDSGNATFKVTVYLLDGSRQWMTGVSEADAIECVRAFAERRAGDLTLATPDGVSPVSIAALAGVRVEVGP